MNILGIIPARYGSSRFPGKPLALLAGKPVIQHVYERAASVLDNLYVATDHPLIYKKVLQFGGKAVMTRSDHQSGTDRTEEATTKIGGDWDIIVNIQGDEPFIHASQIQTLCQCFDNPNTQIATLGVPFADVESLSNPNSPKIVLDNQGYALYFSRSAIPFIRRKQQSEWIGAYPFLKHIGLYAYRRDVLHEITQLPQSSLELAESLEQLRWLQNGYRIQIGITNIETIGIDTPEDLQHAETAIQNQKNTTLESTDAKYIPHT